MAVSVENVAHIFNEGLNLSEKFSHESSQKAVVVTKSHNEWINSQASSGEFANCNAYIHELIRRDQPHFSSRDEILLYRHLFPCIRGDCLPVGTAVWWSGDP